MISAIIGKALALGWSSYLSEFSIRAERLENTRRDLSAHELRALGREVQVGRQRGQRCEQQGDEVYVSCSQNQRDGC
jgi:hypothetical protein